jgi:NAD(P)-dependent dehydrogenase (short-subunit alcohol dehydrogenase family)
MFRIQPLSSAIFGSVKGLRKTAQPTFAKHHISRSCLRPLHETAGQLFTASNCRKNKKAKVAVLKNNYSTDSTGTKPDWILSPDNSTIQKRFASCAGKVAVVTGGARGIGGQIALGLAEAGAKLAIIDVLNQSESEDFATLTEVCPEARYYQSDISNPSEVTSTFADIVKDFKAVDIFVSAAGLIREKPLIEVTPEELMLQINVNLVGTILTSQEAARQMVKQGKGGSILVIASIGSHRALRDQFASCYVMTKWGLRGWVKQVAMELGAHGIRVNSLSPGYTQTPLVVPLLSKERAATWPYVSVLNRMGRPDELKAPAVFLCSDAASYITGTDLLNDGGATCW